MIVLLIQAFESLREIVFLIAVFFSKRQSSIVKFLLLELYSTSIAEFSGA